MALDALLRQVSRDINANLLAVHRDELVPAIYKHRELGQKANDELYRALENDISQEARNSLLETLKDRDAHTRVHESRIAERREAAELRIRAARAEAEEIVRATETDARNHLAYMCVSLGAAAAPEEPAAHPLHPGSRARPPPPRLRERRCQRRCVSAPPSSVSTTADWPPTTRLRWRR